MSDPLVVLLLLTGHEASDPSMTATVRAALGSDAAIVVDERPQALSDEQALARAKRMRADAVAELRWAPARDRVVIHLHVDTIERWLDQEISFEPIDAPSERGRTLGFALAAMISRWREQQEAARPRPFEGPITAVAVGVPTRAALTLDWRAPAPARDRRFAVDLLAAGSIGVGGPGAGVGGAVGLRWMTSRFFGFGARTALRFGRVPSADASARIGAVGGGIVVRPLGPADRGLEWTLRANLLALDHTLARPDADGAGSIRRSRWLTAADVSAEAAWYLAPTVGLVISAGAEVTFGTTDVQVGTERVATLPLTRATTEGGVRLRF